MNGDIDTNGLFKLVNLKHLNLAYNLVSGGLPAGSGWANFEFLESIELQNNRLAGNIPIEMSQLKSLRYIYMQNNYLTGLIPIFTGA